MGDWLLLDQTRLRSSQVLERASVIKRRAPGTDRQEQLIAANIDTAFIVTSCNQDFNIARLERYVALAYEARITPVIVLTKADLATDPQSYINAARAVSDLIDVIALDARGTAPGTELAVWCRPGKTVAFLGSSGVPFSEGTVVEARIGSVIDPEHVVWDQFGKQAARGLRQLSATLGQPKLTLEVTSKAQGHQQEMQDLERGKPIFIDYLVEAEHLLCAFPRPVEVLHGPMDENALEGLGFGQTD